LLSNAAHGIYCAASEVEPSPFIMKISEEQRRPLLSVNFQDLRSEVGERVVGTYNVVLSFVVVEGRNRGFPWLLPV
jgi:hypothetical protein